MLFSKKNLSPKRIQELTAFTKNISIKFSNINLLELAFTHRSVANEKGQKHYNNERLEFLGDSVLGMATAAYLYEHFMDNPEGDLAKIKSSVVSEQSLAPIALKIGIDKMLILGKGEEMSGGRQKKAILADAVEAVIGAYYLDAGYKAAEKLVLSFMIPAIDNYVSDRGSKDYKTLLQEAHQKKYKSCPNYELVKETGPDHERTFWVTVHLKNASYGPESGKSKKEAEQNVAKKAWQEVFGN
ncbi:ribonuclease III [Treponema ruminis]|uniref:Ribonuclease 3 n=1 Tax=Treponema ruminis TaxID=744515 RepID=A0A7W8G7G9_9SPIR|nr:ribonuclease III [Treponema ruminis]MBB5225177.1 ribonuclease-3 [Treponema ruminis]QSI01953.1 ribonuclease III [Treponema ruminis]